MNVLDRIVEHKRREVAARQRACPLEAFSPAQAQPPRDFVGALRQPGIAAIAEVKRRSPSEGLLREELDVPAVARSYARSGAAALSVLTDREFFGGSEDDLRLAGRSVALPVLRKDFTIDEYQIHEARQIGADAILLIARILTDAEMRQYLQTARRLGLATLVEVHNEPDLARAVDCGAEIIGVNNRNLKRLIRTATVSERQVRLDTALRLRDRIPPGCLTVAESGIRTRDDVTQLERAGYDAILVGAALMGAPDPGRKLGELLGTTP